MASVHMCRQSDGADQQACPPFLGDALWGGQAVALPAESTDTPLDLVGAVEPHQRLAGLSGPGGGAIDASPSWTWLRAAQTVQASVRQAAWQRSPRVA